ncbi:acetyl-CoA C-acetyltransferase [Bacillus mesophilus]|uniref:Thiolase family protein n=1 Tax=Bacillus mesophilus TaxID=1808955 RepID=A0A6M0Q6V5_9BACI|nr:thiolase family protein [Bacillus mesophilus]MBM7661402.1 acetyl-CoA C-acetyltransferase [Bacillus mesophilus]NEY72075.1 thiolase family protein [Bacillus mesophilus]
MRKVMIVTAKRTPIGRVGGVLKNISPEKLAAAVIKNIIDELKLPGQEIDEVILGNTIGPGGNLARLAALTAGLPYEIPGVTIDRQCGSGLEAINMAARHIQAGAGHIYLAGGVESTSLAPWKMEKPSSIYTVESPRIYSRARFSPDEIGDPDMGIAAENVAEAFTISRADQDIFADRSQKKAIQSQQSGRFNNEIVAINGIVEDECPRDKTSPERLGRLRPVFKKDGSVTAGNACPINDGAAVVLLMSEEKCQEFGIKPIAQFIDSTSAGVDPTLLGIGPVPAVNKLLSRNHLTVQDLDLVEFNEAFASQVLASLRQLNIPEEIVNVGGGAIALGHPYGASGAILITRLCAELTNLQKKRGLATLGIGGGLGVATLIERV